MAALFISISALKTSDFISSDAFETDSKSLKLDVIANMFVPCAPSPTASKSSFNCDNLVDDHPIATIIVPNLHTAMAKLFPIPNVAPKIIMTTSFDGFSLLIFTLLLET